MRSRQRARRFLLWLAAVTLVMALGLAILLGFELTQKKAVERNIQQQADSLTALVFQFEREFLRLQRQLEVAQAQRGAADVDALSLRFDIFQSRIALLRENPSTVMVVSRPEYVQVMPALDDVSRVLERILGGMPLRWDELAPVIARLDAMAPQVQALSLAASSEVSRVLELQANSMASQINLAIGLTLFQLLLLLLTAAALLARHRRQETERRALEDLNLQLQEAQRKAEAANRGKSQFLANMSHELRTPFNGLMGMLGLLDATPVSAQQRDYIHTAQQSAGHLHTLLNDILDASALESGKLRLKPEPLHLLPLLQAVRDLMLPQAVAKGLRFDARMETLDWPWVRADGTRIKQVLFNLLSNAIKFTETGSVGFVVTSERPDALHLRLCVEVSDTGIGIPPDAQRELFQRFYQVDGGSARKHGGTGLGLEISRSLARMMGGDITVRSTVGAGACFTTTLLLQVCEPLEPALPAAGELSDASPVDAPTPQGVAAAAIVPPADPPTPEEAARAPSPEVPPQIASQAEAQRGTPLSGSPGQPPHDGHVQPSVAPSETPPAPPRILVAEDHPVNQKLLGALLQPLGYALCFCENGQMALDLAREQRFDLILMDVNMPVMDGLDATRGIRALPDARAKIPIVVLTADLMNEAQERALAAGATDFLSKPFKASELRTVVARYVAQPRAVDAA